MNLILLVCISCASNNLGNKANHSAMLSRKKCASDGHFESKPWWRACSGRNVPCLSHGALNDFGMNFCDLIVSVEQSQISPRLVVGAIVVLSGLAVSFLLWLLYVHHASADFTGRWMFLPTLNALLNGLCAIALCVGLYFIKHHSREAHRTSMLLAFAFSSVFLISYVVNHSLHGDTIFPGHGPARTLYLSILASHVILSIVALPMVLTTFFFSLTGRFTMHRRIARFTFPIWLYVSITGVVVFVFLKVYAY
jgi:putative membrane protein